MSMLVCYLLLIRRMVIGTGLVWCHLGILSVFSIGYYVLPILVMRPYLASFDSSDISLALVMQVEFQVSIFFGVLLGFRLFPRPVGFKIERLDSWFAENYRVVFISAFIVYLVVTGLYAQTSYEADDNYLYFVDRDPMMSIWAGTTGLCLALLALGFAMELKSGRKPIAWAFGCAIFITVGLSLSLAQRLATIMPLAMVLAALFVTKQRVAAFRWCLLIVFVLLLSSPFMVFMRETTFNSRGSERTVTAGKEFSFGDNALISSAESIIDRADLLGNSIKLKTYVDSDGYVGWMYYYSVLVSPIPRLLLANKPYVMSNDGTIWGHLSVIAWRMDSGGFGAIGSVTAFGAITAYSQGGWIAVALDGVADGLLIVFLARWLGEGGMLAQLVYIILLPVLTIKRVPPSFLESLTESLPLCVGLLALAVVGLMVGGRKSLVRKRIVLP